MSCWLITIGQSQLSFKMKRIFLIKFLLYQIKTKPRLKNYYKNHLLFNPFSRDIKLNLIQVFSTLISTFQYFNQTSKIHTRNWPEFSQYQKIHGLKSNHSVKDQDQNINSLFSFATPTIEKSTHTWLKLTN